MSNNDEMDVEKDRGHGLRAPKKKNEGHGVRGQTDGSHGTRENEREQGQLEQCHSQVHTGIHITDEDQKQWTEVGGRTTSGNQKANYNQDNSNRFGTRSGGDYYSSDNRSIFGKSNGNRLGQDAERSAEPNKKTNDEATTYSCKTGFIEVRYMCGSWRGFNIVRAIKECVNAARKQDPEFSIIPLHRSGNNICNEMDVPDNREGIECFTDTR
jgi:hypothetical protein